MRNFKFQNATKIIFGRGMASCVGEEILPYGKVQGYYGVLIYGRTTLGWKILNSWESQ